MIAGLRDWRFLGRDTPRELFWGGVSQGASSVSNFGLSLVAARALGPEGLGVVFVGFSVYLVALGLQRALISEPLIAISTRLDGGDRLSAQRSALTVLIVSLLPAGVLIVGVGLALPNQVGSGLVLIAPWIVPSLLQDFWRSVLFQEKRGRAGAVNDLTWVAVMAVCVPFALATGEMWAVLAAWGLGATAGALLGFFQIKIRWIDVLSAWQWWRTKAWAMGRWLGLESVTHAAMSQGLVFVLVFLLGPGPLGGLRAVQTVYAPLSLIGSAITLPALPEVTRRLGDSVVSARQYAARIGGVAGVLTGGYISLTVLGGSDLLTTVFGSDFSRFENLVWPVGASQLVGAAFLGFPILLKGMQWSRALLTTTLIGSVITLVGSTTLALAAGILGAAWGIAIGAGVRSILNVFFVSRAKGFNGAKRQR